MSAEVIHNFSPMFLGTRRPGHFASRGRSRWSRRSLLFFWDSPSRAFCFAWPLPMVAEKLLNFLGLAVPGILLRVAAPDGRGELLNFFPVFLCFVRLSGWFRL